jgi:Methyltransferase domain/Glycosyl transferase family 2
MGEPRRCRQRACTARTPVSSIGPPAGLGSVIVRCSGRFDLTRRCSAALVAHTRSPWELIALVDEVEIETAAYLAGLQDGSSVRVEVVPAQVAGDLGRLLEVARGHYLVMIDVEAVVTEGWLDHLAALADSNPRIGMTGPMSNDVSPPQRVSDPGYTKLEEMRRFASRWRETHRGKWLTARGISGPCRLVKRRVLEAVAKEGTKVDVFGDELASIVGRAGYTSAVACDLFVHKGSWPATPVTPAAPLMAPTRIVSLSRLDFSRRYGDPDTTRALCGYTPPGDTHAVLTLLAYARPLRILEIGTALGHMTANLTEWSPDGARVVSVGSVRGMEIGGATEQACEAPRPGDLGRLVGHFAKAHKAEVIACDTQDFDFARIGPVDFAFVDGGHDLHLALHDSLATYASLSAGGWLVWHDLGNPVPWVRVREAVEQARFAEPVEHVEGTMVAFLRKSGGETRGTGHYSLQTSRH